MQSYNLTVQSQEATRRNGDEEELNLTAVIPSSGGDFNFISLESAIFVKSQYYNAINEYT